MWAWKEAYVGVQIQAEKRVRVVRGEGAGYGEGWGGVRECCSVSPAFVRCGMGASGGGWSQPLEAPPAKSRAAGLPDDAINQGS